MHCATAAFTDPFFAEVDLVEKDPTARQVLFDHASEFARQNQLIFSEASAVTYALALAGLTLKIQNCAMAQRILFRVSAVL